MAATHRIKWLVFSFVALAMIASLCLFCLPSYSADAAVWKVRVNEHANFSGITEYFNDSDDDLRDNDIGNDTISAIAVVDGYVGLFFRDIDYKPVFYPLILMGPIAVSDLSDTHPYWNDKISSIEVSDN